MLRSDEKELDRLLALVEEYIDPQYCQAVLSRYTAALSCQDVDRPPLVVRVPFPNWLKLPEPWGQFTHYPYGLAFRDPVAMMQNQLLHRVVLGILLKNDSPLAIRNDHGTVQVASAMGADWTQEQDNYPWIRPLARIEQVEEMASCNGEIKLTGGILPQSLGTLQFYHDKLAAFPLCRKHIQISLPDLEGPMSITEQLWGSNLFLAFYDKPELLATLMRRIVQNIVRLEAAFRELVVEHLDPLANTQHEYMFPGRLLLRDDSAINISPEQYIEHVRPHDQRLLQQIGGGSIHFCGNGQHLIEAMLEISDLRGLDVGQSWMMDLPAIYRQTRQRNVAITNGMPSRDDLISGKARAMYPTGMVFAYATTDFEDAMEVVKVYQAG